MTHAARATFAPAASVIAGIAMSGLICPSAVFAGEPVTPLHSSSLAHVADVRANTGSDQRYIVQTSSPTASRVVAAVAGIDPDSISSVYTEVLTGFAARLDAAEVALLARQPSVVTITADAPTRAADVQPSPPWGLDRIDQRATTGDDLYSYDTTGQGVTVFVTDTGVRLSHTEFGGRARSGYDFVDGDTEATDCNGHGTHVSGTIAGATYGVAKKADIVSLRVWDCAGSGYMSSLIEGLDWAVDHKPAGAAVVNISGGGSAYPLLDEAVARTVAAGISVVVAAGNDGRDACRTSPARAPAAITVGATNVDDVRASFSNFGSCVDLFAPGVDVLSSVHSSDTSTRSYSGTSMATPHVTGLVARFLQTNPAATPAAVADAMVRAATPNSVVDPVGSPNLLAFAQPPNTLPGAPTAVSAVTSDSAKSARLSWSPPASTGGSPITGYLVSRDGTNANGNGPWSTTLSAFSRSQVFLDLVPGTTYTLTVRAITVSGTGPGVSKTARTTELPGTARIGSSSPGMVTDVPVSVTARWQPPTAGGPVTRYRVTVVNQATGGTRTVAAASTARVTTIPGLTSGASYRVRVVAENGSGRGATSRLSNAVVAR